MNCHENSKEKRSTHNPLKHMLHMIICCGLPMLIVVFLPLITKFNPSAGNVLSRITPFLCPLIMFAMMPMMFGGKKKASCCDKIKNDN